MAMRIATSTIAATISGFVRPGSGEPGAQSEHTEEQPQQTVGRPCSRPDAVADRQVGVGDAQKGDREHHDDREAEHQDDEPVHDRPDQQDHVVGGLRLDVVDQTDDGVGRLRRPVVVGERQRRAFGLVGGFGGGHDRGAYPCPSGGRRVSLRRSSTWSTGCRRRPGRSRWCRRRRARPRTRCRSRPHRQSRS